MKFTFPFLLLLMVCCHYSIGNFSGSDVWFNGMNIPWNHFASDIGGGSFEPYWFQEFFYMCETNHINVARFWLHINGASSPDFSNEGFVRGLPPTFLSELNQIVTLADQHQVVLQLCLWSFDMCKSDPPRDDIVSDWGVSRTYINNALIPMMKNLSGYDNIIIEAVNEPEWCINGPGTTKNQVQLYEMQRFTAMIAEAVHLNSSFTVTTGSASLKWNSAKVGPAIGNWWNDTSLIEANPTHSPNGTLDFYNVHYYDWMYNPTWGFDPCRENASYWELDKPTVIAELPPTSDHYSTDQMMACAFNNGFYGDMFWAYNDDKFPWKDALPALNNFSNQHPSATTYTALKSWLQSLRSHN